jgi:spore maturation protein CgeD
VKVSCVLTSYNRPKFLRQALLGLEGQSWRNYELLLVDDSDPELLDVMKVLSDFDFPKKRIWPWCGHLDGRRDDNRLAVQINRALREATGDLVCYLADDDYYFPDWFEKAVAFFRERPNALQAFGSLHYSTSPHMDYSQTSGVRYYDHPIYEPLGVLDHGQVMHRRRTPPVFWPEAAQMKVDPDGRFFRELAKDGPFLPIPDCSAVVKRLHGKNLQRSDGDVMGIRE